MMDKSDLFQDFRSVDHPVIGADARAQEPVDLCTNSALAALNAIGTAPKGVHQ